MAAAMFVLRRNIKDSPTFKIINKLRSAYKTPSSSTPSTSLSLSPFSHRIPKLLHINGSSTRRSVSVSGRRDFPESFYVFYPMKGEQLEKQFFDSSSESETEEEDSDSEEETDPLVKEDEENMYLSFEMPGLGKEDVKVSVEDNHTLIVKGGAENVAEFSTMFDFAVNRFKVEEIKAEMKNGVLKVIVPKVKEEERKDVVLIKVD